VSSDVSYRTAVTRLDPAGQDEKLLHSTVEEFKRACNIVVSEAWGCSNYGSRHVQSVAYDTIIERTSLKSQHAVLAAHHAADAMRSCFEQQERDCPTRPTFTAPTVRYDARTMTLLDDETVSLTTVGRRVKCPMRLPADDDGYQYGFLEDDAWSLTESTLTLREGEFYLHLGFRREQREVEAAPVDGAVLGVDLGIANLAVTSTARFFSGGRLWHRRRQFARIRTALQQTGTRSARRTLRRIGGRERRFARDVIHRVANGILAEARRYDCSIIAVEALEGIRDRLSGATAIHTWAFRRLVAYLTYKAREYGISVASVDPASTSRRCADCDHVAESNRPTRSKFECERCGMSANADYNAAKNIGIKHVRRGPQSSRRTGTSHCALKSGTVTPNGEFTAYPPGFEAEFADKPADC
jgi:IS605 OrfB family transposase